MTCEEVRDLLPEHLLGSLDDTSDARVRKHLRGCADAARSACAWRMASRPCPTPPMSRIRPRSCADTCSMSCPRSGTSRATTRTPASAPAAHGSAWRWLAVAAAIILVTVSLSWGVSQSRRAAGLQADAGAIKHCWTRSAARSSVWASCSRRTDRPLKGTVVLYDGEPGKDWNSWGIVMANAPDFSGEAHVRLRAERGLAADAIAGLRER